MCTIFVFMIVTSIKPEIGKLNFCKPVTGNYSIVRPPTTFWTFRVQVEWDPGKTAAASLTNNNKIAGSFQSLHTSKESLLKKTPAETAIRKQHWVSDRPVFTKNLKNKLKKLINEGDLNENRVPDFLLYL